MIQVEQKHPDGCGVATFAMVSGLSWEEAVDELGFAGDPLDFRYLRRKLEEHGFFCRAALTPRDPGCNGYWPPPPFAPLHTAAVITSTGTSHYVAMDGSGWVYDPLDSSDVAGRKRLFDYPVISEVLGLIMMNH